jgi:hypothetical protein
MAIDAVRRPTQTPPAARPPAARRAAPQKKAAGQKPPAQRPAAAQKPAAAQNPPRGPLGALKDAARPYVQAAQDKLEALGNKLNPPLTAEQKKAAQTMHDMLGPDKLGGADRTFNHQDVDAVVKGLTDSGLKGIVARRVVASQLPKGLDEAGVKKDPAAAPDGAPRKLSSDDLRRFEAASDVMKARSAFLDKLGVQVQFPAGISQDAVSHLLEGKFGLPPGAQLVPAEKWPQ